MAMSVELRRALERVQAAKQPAEVKRCVAAFGQLILTTKGPAALGSEQSLAHAYLSRSPSAIELFSALTRVNECNLTGAEVTSAQTRCMIALGKLLYRHCKSCCQSCRLAAQRIARMIVESDVHYRVLEGLLSSDDMKVVGSGLHGLLGVMSVPVVVPGLLSKLRWASFRALRRIPRIEDASARFAFLELACVTIQYNDMELIIEVLKHLFPFLHRTVLGGISILNYEEAEHFLSLIYSHVFDAKGIPDWLKLRVLSENVLQRLTESSIGSGKSESVASAVFDFIARVMKYLIGQRLSAGRIGRLDARRTIVMQILTHLQPMLDVKHQQLVLATLDNVEWARTGYFEHFNCALEPRLSWRWIANVQFLGKLLRMPLKDDISQDIPKFIRNEGVGKLLGHGLKLGARPLVVDTTLALLVRVFGRFEAWTKMKAATKRQPRRMKEFEDVIDNFLPEASIILNLRSRLASSFRPLKHSRQAELLYTKLLLVLRGYSMFRPSFASQNRYDLWKMCESDVVDMPAPCREATFSLLITHGFGSNMIWNPKTIEVLCICVTKHLSTGARALLIELLQHAGWFEHSSRLELLAWVDLLKEDTVVEFSSLVSRLGADPQVFKCFTSSLSCGTSFVSRGCSLLAAASLEVDRDSSPPMRWLICEVWKLILCLSVDGEALAREVVANEAVMTSIGDCTGDKRKRSHLQYREGVVSMCAEFERVGSASIGSKIKRSDDTAEPSVYEIASFCARLREGSEGIDLHKVKSILSTIACAQDRAAFIPLIRSCIYTALQKDVYSPIAVFEALCDALVSCCDGMLEHGTLAWDDLIGVSLRSSPDDERTLIILSCIDRLCSFPWIHRLVVDRTSCFIQNESHSSALSLLPAISLLCEQMRKMSTPLTTSLVMVFPRVFDWSPRWGLRLLECCPRAFLECNVQRKLDVQANLTRVISVAMPLCDLLSIAAIIEESAKHLWLDYCSDEFLAALMNRIEVADVVDVQIALHRVIRILLRFASVEQLGFYASRYRSKCDVQACAWILSLSGYILRSRQIAVRIQDQLLDDLAALAANVSALNAEYNTLCVQSLIDVCTSLEETHPDVLKLIASSLMLASTKGIIVFSLDLIRIFIRQDLRCDVAINIAQRSVSALIRVLRENQLHNIETAREVEEAKILFEAIDFTSFPASQDTKSLANDLHELLRVFFAGSASHIASSAVLKLLSTIFSVAMHFDSSPKSYQMTVSHILKSTVMQRLAGVNGFRFLDDDCHISIAHILSRVQQVQRRIFESKAIQFVILAAYDGTTSEKDRAWFRIIQSWPLSKSPVAFGAYARELLSTGKGQVPDGVHGSQAAWIFAQLRSDYLVHGTAHIAGSRICYEARFLLPWISAWFMSGTPNLRQLTDSGILCFVVRCMSSDDVEVRRGCYSVAADILNRLQLGQHGNDGDRELVYVKLLLESIRNAITEDFQRLPSVTTSIVGRLLQVLCRPSHPLYADGCSLALRKPVFDTDDVPLFLHTFFSGSIQECKPHRQWLLNTLIEALDTSLDSFILNRRHCLPLMLGYFGTFSSEEDALIVRLIQRACQVPGCASVLLNENAIIGWLEHCIAPFLSRNARHPKKLLHALLEVIKSAGNLLLGMKPAPYSLVYQLSLLSSTVMRIMVGISDRQTIRSCIEALNVCGTLLPRVRLPMVWVFSVSQSTSNVWSRSFFLFFLKCELEIESDVDSDTFIRMVEHMLHAFNTKGELDLVGDCLLHLLDNVSGTLLKLFASASDRIETLLSRFASFVALKSLDSSSFRRNIDALQSIKRAIHCEKI